MPLHFNIEQFIREHITRRPQSLFLPDMEDHAAKLHTEIKDKNVLVIGGAGTIGSSFIRALVQYLPGKLIVVDINENGLTELVRDCRSRPELQLPDDFKTYPVNFSDKAFRKIFEHEGPFDIVANFAAHKHVRSEKDIFSIEAMVENNVTRAKDLLDLLTQYPPKHFFCVSTDKAANPVNVMGASKKLMEEVILAYSGKMKITTARFANVAFSNGSLLAGFIERILKQQPLSCPSDVKRFFVSPDESGQICLCACILGQSGEIFFPKLDTSSMVNFADVVPSFLAEMGFKIKRCTSEEAAKNAIDMIRDGYYPVYFFPSSTSGEKLYEEFYTDEEELDTATFQSLGIVKNAKRRRIADLDKIIETLKQVFEDTKAEKKDIVSALNSMIPGFEHIETGINLDQKM
ncbi:polysaccharide biosynthesis protein [Niabella drilacis]|uniref:Polysaccharide biosynthesis protein n=1 Tax=Niabella drilacis (strain DSM 25811 / CCM 8410 / CCUG 62505 / LMG 26954 / E90) TaxID=1285928 RepID=A0A1G6QVA3_NIADE|nr:polysaccharide biosynthesis protein [Niabella drilacis]SDC95627.1 Polysaccharide biosynthesis protein [Niabella drilacis]